MKLHYAHFVNTMIQEQPS